MIFGVSRINGEKRNVAPVFPTVHRRRLGGFCFAQRFSRENMRNFMLMDGNHRQGFFAVDRPNHLSNFAARQSLTTRGNQVHFNKIASFSVFQLCRIELHLRLFSVYRVQPPFTVAELANNTQHRVRAVLETLHDAGGIIWSVAIFTAEYFRQNAIPDAHCGTAFRSFIQSGAADQDNRWFAVTGLVPFRRTCEQAAILVASCNIKHSNGR